MKCFPPFSFFFWAVSGLSQAQFTFIDADLSNTTLAGDPLTLEEPANYVSGVAGSTDNLWSYRFANGFEGGAYFESDSGTPNVDNGESNDRESTPDLITTITLPAAGSYQIVAIFSNNSGRRDIAANIGSSPGAGNVFNRDNSFNADQDAVPLEIEFTSSYTNGRGDTASAANLGTFTTTSANEEVSVFVNGLASTDEIDDERTRFDGLGYEFLGPPAGPLHHDVFIIAGQSNGDGRGLANELTGPLEDFSGVQSNAIIYYSNPGRYGDLSDPNYLAWVPLEPGYSVAPREEGPLPTNSFGHEIAAATILTQHFENVAFIKVTEGGTSLTLTGQDWHPPIPDPDEAGRLYTDLVTVVPAALQALTDRGDTYTLHALYWHQGESDGSRPERYPAEMERFVRSFRTDLGKPNLRFVVGALAPRRGPTFIPIQWQVSRDLRNASFVSSLGLRTTDGTHFDTPSVIEMGLRVGEALAQQGRVLDFSESGFENTALTEEGDFEDFSLFEDATLNQQGDFSTANEIVVINTDDSGDYSGGQAIAESATTGPHSGNLRRVLPLAEARAMKASFFANDSDSTLLLAGWGQDLNDDEVFDEDEAGLGMGLGSDGLFRLRVGANEVLSSNVSYQSNNWYELTATWGEPDPTSGQSVISLFVTNLTTSTILNGGAAVAFTTAEVAPAAWLGTGILMDNGAMDNIGVEGPGFQGWVENRFPSLEGGATEDDDSDGLVNSFEYAYGLNPLVANNVEDSPSPTLNGDEFRLSLPEFPRAEDVLVEVYESTDLLSWDLVDGVEGDGSRDFIFSTTDIPRLFLSTSLEICE